jgi:hypothetical protein
VDADAQAGMYNMDHGVVRPFVLMSPNTRAHLLFSDGTVTGHYSRELLHQASAKPLFEYIRRRNEWSESTLQAINWEAHAAAISMPHTHVVKLVHRILPTYQNEFRVLSKISLSPFSRGGRSSRG